MKKKRLNIALFLFMAVVNIYTVMAANNLQPAFDALTNLGILETVAKYPVIWDAILFTWLFVIVGRNVLGKRLSPQAGTVIGLILGASLLSGEIAFNFSLIKNFGPWVLVAASVAVIFFLVRIFFNEEGNRFGTSALGIFLITSILLYGFPTIGQMLKDTSGFLYGMIVVINTLAMIGAVIWLFRFIFPARAGGGNTATGRLGDWLGRQADGRNRLRDGMDQWRNRPTQQDTGQVQAQIRRYQGNVNGFITQANAFIAWVNGHGQNVSAAIASLPPQQRAQFASQLTAHVNRLYPQIAAITTEFNEINSSNALNNVPRAELTNFINSSQRLTAVFGNIATVLI